MSGYDRFAHRPGHLAWADMTDEQRHLRLLHNEAEAYRSAIVRLCTIGGQYHGRKTVPVDAVVEIASAALDTGNGWSRKVREL